MTPPAAFTSIQAFTDRLSARGRAVMALLVAAVAVAVIVAVSTVIGSAGSTSTGTPASGQGTAILRTAGDVDDTTVAAALTDLGIDVTLPPMADTPNGTTVATDDGRYVAAGRPAGIPTLSVTAPDGPVDGPALSDPAATLTAIYARAGIAVDAAHVTTTATQVTYAPADGPSLATVNMTGTGQVTSASITFASTTTHPVEVVATVEDLHPQIAAAVTNTLPVARPDGPAGDATDLTVDTATATYVTADTPGVLVPGWVVTGTLAGTPFTVHATGVDDLPDDLR